jgi:hypothetical protein
MIRVEDCLKLIDDCTFGDDVVHPDGKLADKASAPASTFGALVGTTV